MTYEAFVENLREFDGSLPIYIASSVLMPLDYLEAVPENDFHNIYLNQYRGEYEDFVKEVYVQDLLDFLEDYNDLSMIWIKSAFLQPIDYMDQHVVATLKKLGRNRSVAVKDAWNANPVDESTAHEALVIFNK